MATRLPSFAGGTRTTAGLAPDHYLTDGRRLLRVVSQFDPRSDFALAALEDCLNLEVRAYSPGELAALKLRPVLVPAAAEGADRTC